MAEELTPPAAPKKRGRKSKLNPETVAALIEVIESGGTYELACMAAGVGETTFFRWMREGEAAQDSTAKATEELRQFWHRVKAAEGKAAKEALANIREAGKTAWQASAWLLERRYPDQYSLRRRGMYDSTSSKTVVAEPAPVAPVPKDAFDYDAYAADYAAVHRLPDVGGESAPPAGSGDREPVDSDHAHEAAGGVPHGTAA